MSKNSTSKTIKVGFVSLGCPKNLVDSEVMLGTLSKDGYEITANKENADVIVVNTCSFIDSAKAESVDTILEMARLKETGQCRKLVVAGCLAERYRDEIKKEIPEIDFIFGPDELGQILEAVRVDGTVPVPDLKIDSLYTSREVPTIPRLRTTAKHMAYLKIAEGCDHVCTFCAIPGFRGRFRSRTVDDLTSESERLASDGARELIIVSQDTLAYGKDLGLGGTGIEKLLDGLLGVQTVDWIRLLYCYPNLLSDRLIKRIANEERICSYFDIPYQHASPQVLERMARGGGRATFERQVERIREIVPEAGIRTSFIVGFPGETDDDFDELMRFVECAKFDNLGVFLYSDEEGTPAFDLTGKVDREVAETRRNQLMSLQADIVRERLPDMVGRQIPVLLEGLSSESDLLLQGRTEIQAPEIDGVVLINDAGEFEPVSGQFYLTEITECLEYDLVGRIVKPL
jgi:ribosomal protein S12 methylthiotransferase